MPQILPAAFDPLGQAGMTRTCGMSWASLFPLARPLPEVLVTHKHLGITLGWLGVSSFFNLTVLVSSGEAGPCQSWSNLKFTRHRTSSVSQLEVQMHVLS